MLNIITPEQAAEMIQDNEIIAFNGFGSLSFPEPIALAVGERFQKTGHPRNMTFIHHAGQGVWQDGRMIENMCQPGMVRCVIGSHITPMVRISDMLQRNEIEGYNLPMGVISHLIRAAAGAKPGILTKVGLKTFVDPRYGGCGLNEISKDELAKVVEIDGEEYLFYKAVKPTFTMLRGTTADPKGNITLENEALFLDAFTTAMAVKANKGKVVVQVERLSQLPADPRKVKIPGIIVDAIVVVPDQWMSLITRHNGAYIGEYRVPDDSVIEMVEQIREAGSEAGRKRERNILHNIIARRAAMELSSGDIVNLGIGIPEMVPAAAKELGLPTDFTLTVEAGAIGGVPAPSLDFGAAINPDVIMDMALQLDFYDGGGLDITFLGAMELDAAGNVNVGMSGDRIIGVGGFPNITQATKKIVYCFPFTAGGLKIDIGDSGMKILQEGRHRKFREKIDQISFSGELAMETPDRKVLYVTERCVFALRKEGLELIEIAPGISLEEDILANMDFKPIINENIKKMDPRLFMQT